jgi:hypothetical protein
MDGVDWKHFLRGGFAFDAADFACHPTDAFFARKMHYACLVDKISIEEIKAEVRAYFQSKGAHEIQIADRVKDVEEFCKSIKPVKKKEKAWLITWQHTQDDELIEETIISVRSSRVAEKTIADFVEQYYIATHFSLAAKMTFATVSSSAFPK